MNSKSTFWLMVGALGLGAYIFVFERHTLNTEERAQQAAKLFPDFDPAQVASVEFCARTTSSSSAPSAPTTSAAGAAGVSCAVHGHRQLAESVQVSRPARLPLRAGPAGAIGRPGRVRPGLTASDGDDSEGTRKIHVLLGAKTPVGEKIYLQQVGADGAFVTDSALLTPAAVGNRLRDPTFVDFSALKFDQLNVRAGQRDFEVKRGPGAALWRLSNRVRCAPTTHCCSDCFRSCRRRG